MDIYNNGSEESDIFIDRQPIDIEGCPLELVAVNAKGVYAVNVTVYPNIENVSSLTFFQYKLLQVSCEFDIFY